MINLREEIQTIIGINPQGPLKLTTDEVIEKIKQWALEIVGEDKGKVVLGNGIDITKGVNLTKQEIRQRIEEATK